MCDDRRRLRSGRARVPYALAIHGGAGIIERSAMTPSQKARYRAALLRALKAGRNVLAHGGSSLDAVVAAVAVMEDSPLFNAGRGAVYNAAGGHELDASIMDGVTLRAGAVAGVRRIRNPIMAARLVMDSNEQVLLAGSAADRLASKHGLAIVTPEYFATASRRAALEQERLRRRGLAALPASDSQLHGTVGAVALDVAGNLAAGTSTGGYTHKAEGRIGDSAIIGAGTYADNNTCAVSCTGRGEFFMRAVAAHDVGVRMRDLNLPLAEAASRALAAVERLGGTGGLIALDGHGQIAMPFNTPGMYRARVTAHSRAQVAIFA
jgi:beta-aspartyl-peptidase (threonine type)